MRAAGVAPESRPQRLLTPDGLAAAITRGGTDSGMARRAVGLGERIRPEDGTAAAVRALEMVDRAARFR